MWQRHLNLMQTEFDTPPVSPMSPRSIAPNRAAGRSGNPILRVDDLENAPASDDDGPLLEGLRRNDAQAFEALVRRYGDYLYGVARRVAGSEAEAQDAVQDSFINVLRHIGDFQGQSSLKTWLYRLTVNATLTRLRAARRRQEISIDELAPPLEGVREEPEWNFSESPEASSAREDVRAAVRACIDRLPDNYRIVLVLRDVEGKDTREVAELLGETEGNVKVRLHRARAALKKLLEPLYRSEAL